MDEENLNKGFLFPEEESAIKDKNIMKEALQKVDFLKKFANEILALTTQKLSGVYEVLKKCNQLVADGTSKLSDVSSFATAEKKKEIYNAFLRMAIKLENDLCEAREKQTEYNMLGEKFSFWFSSYDLIPETLREGLGDLFQKTEAAYGNFYSSRSALSEFFSVSVPLFLEKLGEVMDVDHQGAEMNLSFANALFSSFSRIEDRLFQTLLQVNEKTDS